MVDSVSLLLLLVSWLGYFLIHSALASIKVKDFVLLHWPMLMPMYRITFNTLAVFLLLPPLWLTLSWPGEWLWRWQGGAEWLAWGITLSAVIGFFWSLRYYDGSEFLGLRQLQNRITAVEDQETFQLSPLHCWVRHPWYLFALMLIWSRDMNAAWLLSSLMMTLYFVIGSRMEERKLVLYHGEVYRRYQQLVPGLIPRPWRYLSEAQRRELVER